MKAKKPSDVGSFWNEDPFIRPAWLSVCWKWGKWMCGVWYAFNSIKVLKDYAYDFKAKEWVPFPVYRLEHMKEKQCKKCINNPDICICENKYEMYKKNGFRPMPEQLEMEI